MIFPLSLLTFGQDTSANDSIASDSTDIEILSAPNMPRRAMLYSAILPGLGQVYNKEYWKVPIALGGFVALGWLINNYNEEYIFAKTELYRIFDDPNYEPRIIITEDQLRRRVEVFRRERDYMMVLTGIFYMLQMVDAHIDSHLKEFGENPNMEVKLQPSQSALPTGGGVYGFGITIKF